jgi:hypothetical protein
VTNKYSFSHSAALYEIIINIFLFAGKEYEGLSIISGTGATICIAVAVA